jgi:hypothetical protein
MPFRRIGACVVAAVAVAAGLVIPPADAAGQTWSGRYSLVRNASGKTGTSLAASQWEPDFSDEYVFATDCRTGTCIATVVDGPQPKNPTLPQPPRYTWDGEKWVHIYNWQWDCYQGDGVPKVWAPARSIAFYAPMSDGSLRGSWRTDIQGGPCNGFVEMAVAAFPVY